jgi:membrane-associated protein
VNNKPSMELISQIIDFTLNISHHLDTFVELYGAWIYVILFAIIFCETGVILTPFLPGDSMLFVLGAIAANGKLSLNILIPSLVTAAILGYSLNYFVGTKLAHKIMDENQLKFIKRKYIHQTQAFYEKYGPKAVVMARFVPIMRTFAPFLAGVGNMNKKQFMFFNVASAILWIPTIIAVGYFFGNITIVREKFTTVVFVIIGVSILPIVYEFFKKKKNKSKSIR